MESKISKSSSAIHHELLRLSQPIRESLSKAHYNQPESTNVSTKSLLESLLPNQNPNPNEIEVEIRDFCLCLAALASVSSEKGEFLLSWVPRELSIAANDAFEELSKVYFGGLGGEEECVGGEFRGVSEEKKLVVKLMPEVFPLLKDTIKASSIDTSDDGGDEIAAASARSPVGYAIVAACQFRWFATQIDYTHLGKLCSLVIPCALTILDHWSPQVKGEGMRSFVHLMKNVSAAELSWYEDVILDICCRNIASTDELWHHVVEMSVLSLIYFQGKNPRSSWFEKMMNEMLSHLERQPRLKERRTAWLELIEPVLNSMGLVLLAHFRRIFSLFFQWMHADDDKTVLLLTWNHFLVEPAITYSMDEELNVSMILQVLQRVYTVMKLTWIRNTSYTERLIDELAITYKEAALKRNRDEIREHVLRILILLQQYAFFSPH
ncbi:hypothetical protein GIB67_007594 [Kingdonia uniflora]|uniref:ARM repeat superfamily protein n=1 Tax=Kingdonia uniflora TaxID=39325 RepID=A0A7J7N1E8_9MAGN|nr:hypothetical protein GIB67_007594 [Kingdonia uniflora]